MQLCSKNESDKEDKMNLMNLVIDRVKSDDDTTLSFIYLDEVFQCFGLENDYDEVKVVGSTRIPAGHYIVGVRNTGGFDSRYRNKFPDLHKGMLQVMDVPGYEYILLHIGNTNKDTAGCLLVGKGASMGEEITITNSTGAYKDLYAKVIKAAEQGLLTIEYKDSDRV